MSAFDVLAVSAVALRKESVDRNTQRRDFKALGLPVALRKESVDRNSHRAVNIQRPAAVALRKESVDRNKYVVQCRKTLGGRSPQGERG